MAEGAGVPCNPKIPGYATEKQARWYGTDFRSLACIRSLWAYRVRYVGLLIVNQNIVRPYSFSLVSGKSLYSIINKEK